MKTILCSLGTLFLSNLAVAASFPCDLSCSGSLTGEEFAPISYCARYTETEQGVSADVTIENEQTSEVLVHEQAKVSEGQSSAKIEGAASLLQIDDIQQALQAKLQFLSGEVSASLEVRCDIIH